jgi:hypothetical protein
MCDGVIYNGWSKEIKIEMLYILLIIIYNIMQMESKHQQDQQEKYYNQLKKLIEEYHNPNLVIPDESPNGNIIYHIYDSGTITYQKGGWAYLGRSEFTKSLFYVKKRFPELFPIKLNSKSYAVVTEEHSYIIQSLMIHMDS